MHISEAFPHVYAALSDALDSLGFRARDAWVGEFLVAELKEMAVAEEELSEASSITRRHLFSGGFADGTFAHSVVARLPHTFALTERLLGRYRDEPGDARFLA
jgi:hypothetical protein